MSNNKKRSLILKQLLVICQVFMFKYNAEERERPKQAAEAFRYTHKYVQPYFSSCVGDSCI